MCGGISGFPVLGGMTSIEWAGTRSVNHPAMLRTGARLWAAGWLEQSHQIKSCSTQNVNRSPIEILLNITKLSSVLRAMWPLCIHAHSVFLSTSNYQAPIKWWASARCKGHRRKKNAVPALKKHPRWKKNKKTNLFQHSVMKAEIESNTGEDQALTKVFAEEMMLDQERQKSWS